MLTTHDLVGFVDQLGDLTRPADPMDIVVEANALAVDNRAWRFLMQHRAAATADAHYLHGVRLAQIARAAGVSAQAARNWLDGHGPSHYLSIAEVPPGPDPAAHTDYGVALREAGGRRFTLRLIRFEDSDSLMKRKLREQRAGGRRIVPASLNLVDLEQPDGIAAPERWPVPVDQLWDELGN